MAHREIESIRLQSRAEVLRIQKDAQSHVSHMEGRMNELIEINQQMSNKMDEQSHIIETMARQIDNQNAVIAQMQSDAMRSSPRAVDATEFPIHTPVGRQILQPVSAIGFGMSDGLLPYAQDAVQPQPSAKPLGSAGEKQMGFGHKGKKGSKVSKESSSPKHSGTEAMLSQLKLMVQNLEARIPKPSSPKASSEKSKASSKSSHSSSSSDSKRGGGSPGGSDGGGSERSKHSSSRSSSSDSDQDEYKKEKRVMRVKGYDAMRLPIIPKNGAEARGYRNSIYSAVCKLAKKDESKVFSWISKCNSALTPGEIVSGEFPILDRIIGHKLLESSRGTRFSLDFQTVQESHQKKGKQPSGRLLLWTIFQKFKLDKDRGAGGLQCRSITCLP